MSIEKPVTHGELIRHLRHFKGLKQSIVAKKMGVSQQAYSKLESAKVISPQNIAKLLNAMGSSLGELEKIKKILPRPLHNLMRVFCQ